MTISSRQGTATLAVLIDADNAAPAIVEGLLAEVAKYGVAAVKRIYGDWTKPNLAGWKERLLSHSIQPIQQFRYTVGKNATDSAMIIDAMDLLYTGRFDGFCIVSSDSDFTRLASRIREQGLTVYGFGERKTPKPFVTACDKFIFADVLRSDADADTDTEADGAAAPARKRNSGELRQDSRLVRLLQSASQAVSDEDGWATLGGMGNHIAKQAPEFDSRNYGYGKLSELVAATGLFEVETRNGNNNKTLWVRLKRRSKTGEAEPRQGDERQAENRQAENRQGENRQGENRQGENRQSENRQSENRQPESRQGENRQGENRQGENRQGENRQPESRQPESRQGENRQGENVQAESPQAENRENRDNRERRENRRNKRRGGDRQPFPQQQGSRPERAQQAALPLQPAPVPEFAASAPAPVSETAPSFVVDPMDVLERAEQAYNGAESEDEQDDADAGENGDSNGGRRRKPPKPEVTLSEIPWPIDSSIFVAPSSTVVAAVVEAAEVIEIVEVAPVVEAVEVVEVVEVAPVVEAAEVVEVAEPVEPVVEVKAKAKAPARAKKTAAPAKKAAAPAKKADAPAKKAEAPAKKTAVAAKKAAAPAKKAAAPAKKAAPAAKKAAAAAPAKRAPKKTAKAAE
ncbi:NYN domain-containing protein [Cupriavidus basilensis]|uniref:NYN domain-containing protein n=1 Tax=Cupriavidus basilensis TaxID=68895 RepID=A0A643FMC3_9BURK|nr:NYN domain-containing protein [Cupriavidus basilensis]QOT76245.1 NYN domain-containing protein [Cupriavidus basilensis]